MNIQEKARRRWDNVAKPLHSLGLLEDLIVRIAGVQETENVNIDRRCAVVFCGDHGVVRQGVSQTDSSVTALVAEAIAEGTGNINLYELDYNGVKPEMFNQYYMLVPCFFWMDNVDVNDYEKELAKHRFSLLVPEDLHNSDGVLNLTLIDDVTDPEVDRYKNSWQYQAFNLQSVITGFKSINGKLNTIRIWGSVNRNSYDPEEGRTDRTRYVDIDLTPFQ